MLLRKAAYQLAAPADISAKSSPRPAGKSPLAIFAIPEKSHSYPIINWITSSPIIGRPGKLRTVSGSAFITDVVFVLLGVFITFISFLLFPVEHYANLHSH